MITRVREAGQRARATLAARPTWEARAVDVVHLARYGRLYATGAAAWALGRVADELSGTVGTLTDIASDAWVTAGRRWERSTGIPPGHPDAVWSGPDAPRTTAEQYAERYARAGQGDYPCPCCGWHHDEPGEE